MRDGTGQDGILWMVLALALALVLAGGMEAIYLGVGVNVLSFLVASFRSSVPFRDTLSRQSFIPFPFLFLGGKRGGVLSVYE